MNFEWLKTTIVHLECQLRYRRCHFPLTVELMCQRCFCKTEHIGNQMTESGKMFIVFFNKYKRMSL